MGLTEVLFNSLIDQVWMEHGMNCSLPMFICSSYLVKFAIHGPPDDMMKCIIAMAIYLLFIFGTRGIFFIFFIFFIL